MTGLRPYLRSAAFLLGATALLLIFFAPVILSGGAWWSLVHVFATFFVLFVILVTDP